MKELSFGKSRKQTHSRSRHTDKNQLTFLREAVEKWTIKAEEKADVNADGLMVADIYTLLAHFLSIYLIFLTDLTIVYKCIQG